jgi:hypothetical protein
MAQAQSESKVWNIFADGAWSSHNSPRVRKTAQRLADERLQMDVREGKGAQSQRFRTGLLVRHFRGRIIGPYGGLQLGGIDFLTLRPFYKIFWPVDRIGTPSLEYAGVDRLVDVDVAAVVSHIRLSADGAVERREVRIVALLASMASQKLIARRSRDSGLSLP